MKVDLPPGLLSAFSSVGSQVLEQNKTLFGGLSEHLSALSAVVGKIDLPKFDVSPLTNIRVIPEDFEWPKLFPDDFFESLQESYRRSFPKCWPNRTGNIETAMTIAQRNSFPMVDFPSKASALKVFAAFDRGDDIDAVIGGLKSEIAQDFLTRDSSELPINDRYDKPLQEVAECLSSGKHMAAQSLSFSILEDIWSHFGPKKRKNDVFTKFLDKSSYDDEPIHLLKWTIVLASSFSAYEWIDFRKAGYPNNVHRHATAHSISEVQYTETNAVKAFVIAVTTASLCSQPGLALDETKRLFNQQVLGIDFA
jgi:hypothetical protein